MGKYIYILFIYILYSSIFCVAIYNSVGKVYARPSEGQMYEMRQLVCLLAQCTYKLYSFILCVAVFNSVSVPQNIQTVTYSQGGFFAVRRSDCTYFEGGGRISIMTDQFHLGEFAMHMLT